MADTQTTSSNRTPPPPASTFISARASIYVPATEAEVVAWITLAAMEAIPWGSLVSIKMLYPDMARDLEVVGYSGVGGVLHNLEAVMLQHFMRGQR